MSKMKVKTLEVNPFRENTYIIYDETCECAIIDCGCLYDKEKEALKTFIAENKLTPKRLLNTHLHIDHALGNRFIFNEYGLKAEAHQADEFLLTNMKKQSETFGMPMKDEPMPLGSYLTEKDEVKFGNITLQLFHVPGHSPGSLVFYAKNDGLLFTGDVLFYESIGRADLPGGDYEALISNIRKKLLVLPKETIVFPGHGETTTVGHEKQYNPYL